MLRVGSIVLISLTLSCSSGAQGPISSLVTCTADPNGVTFRQALAVADPIATMWAPDAALASILATAIDASGKGGWTAYYVSQLKNEGLAVYADQTAKIVDYVSDPFDKPGNVAAAAQAFTLWRTQTTDSPQWTSAISDVLNGERTMSISGTDLVACSQVPSDALWLNVAVDDPNKTFTVPSGERVRCASVGSRCIEIAPTVKGFTQ